MKSSICISHFVLKCMVNMEHEAEMYGKPLGTDVLFLIPGEKEVSEGCTERKKTD